LINQLVLLTATPSVLEIIWERFYFKN